MSASDILKQFLLFLHVDCDLSDQISIISETLFDQRNRLTRDNITGGWMGGCFRETPRTGHICNNNKQHKC